MHSLGVGNYPWENIKDVSGPVLLGRISSLKDPRQWPHRPFFITFSHHFNNTLCGHAHSVPGLASKILFDQREMRDRGFTALGFEAALALLGLDNNLRPDGSPRILIDVKHMSARGRQDYYDRIVRPYNARPENAANKIPIVASHVGYSGVSHLQAQIDKALGNEERDNYKVDGFYAWNINVSNEDVIEIHKSGGLIGLSFDQRIMGLDKVLIAFNLQDFLKGKKKKRREAQRAMRRTIEAIARIPFDNALAEPHRIWDELSIGTDFDGFIDPLFGYSTMLDFPDFEKDLVESLEEIKKAHPNWFGTLDAHQAARKICFENARDFVLRHYQ
jgi:microsomal dipeptidase-like Zn-dependent dipeptidase